MAGCAGSSRKIASTCNGLTKMQVFCVWGLRFLFVVNEVEEKFDGVLYSGGRAEYGMGNEYGL